MLKNKINFLPDTAINTQENAKLIHSLSICFPHQPLFNTQRFYKECPQYRWFIENENQIIAHVAVHDKEILSNNEKIRIGGIAEVFVLPDHRKQGLAKLLLNEAEKWMQKEGINFSVLYGEEKIYQSSGYYTIDEIVRYKDFPSNEWIEEKSKDLMVKELTDKKFPKGNIDLQGPTF